VFSSFAFFPENIKDENMYFQSLLLLPYFESAIVIDDINLVFGMDFPQKVNLNILGTFSPEWYCPFKNKNFLENKIW
jgi:hypothetical protein